jgi:hypothetical protein
MPRSSVIEITSSLAELNENARILQSFDAHLLKSAGGSSASTLEEIYIDASDIRRIAVRLLWGLSLPRPMKHTTAESTGPDLLIAQVNASIAELDAAIKVFIDSPVLHNSGTIDPGSLSKAGADLEAIYSRSARLQQLAELLINNQRAKRGKPAVSMSDLKSKLKPKVLLQLTIDCDSWSMDALLNKPAESKSEGSIRIGKIEAKTRRHKLAQPLVVPIESCVDAEADEKATDEGLQYVAVVKEFTSYEVTKRAFAYQVNYEIALARDRIIQKHFPQPLTFYYVDETGEGGFELLKRPLPLGLVPDWAAELAGKQ